MFAIKKSTGKALGIPTGLAVGILVSLLVTFIGAAITASVVASEKIGEGAIGYAVMVILAISSALGALVSVSLTKRLRLQVSLLSGIGYFLALLAMTALFFGGQYQGIGVCAIVIMAMSMLIVFLPTKSSKIGKSRKRSYR